MPFDISGEVLEALQPVRLPQDASVIEHHRDAVITWPASGEGGQKEAIRVEEIVLVAQLMNEGYLILALQQEDGEEPFHLSSFLASSLPSSLFDQYVVKDLPNWLSSEACLSLDVLVSVRSGTGLAEKFFNAVLQPLLAVLGMEGQGHHGTENKSYTVTLTRSATTVKEFAKTTLAANSSPISDATKSKAVILLSGDGGLVDLLNDINPSTSLPTVALIPLGTGNALFHSLHKAHYTNSATSPSHLVLALRALLKGRAAPLPTFQASFSTGAHLVDNDAPNSRGLPVSELVGAIVASYGLHSQLVWESDTPAYRKHGAKRFGMLAEELLKEPHGYRAAVETPEGRIGTDEVPFNYILATMVSNLEKTFTISPASQPLDGQLRLVHFGGATGQRTMEIMGAAYDGGKHVGMKGVGYQAVEEVNVTTSEDDARWRKVCIDGTIVELPQGGTMVVRKSSEARIQVLVLGA